ncbi:MAG: acyl-CoA dehydrogenase [Caulobacteraceae bacterium]|nr:acyl-CoA dehydrogenase [Caulobacteraceae bacterium]
MTFQAPVRDLLFALTDVIDIDRLRATQAFADLDLETVAAVLEAAGAIATDVLAPLNRAGDKSGATYANGKVTAAPGFAEAYKTFAEGGWNSLAADPDFGGQGLPKALELAVFEMMHAANMAFSLCPMLTQGAIEAIHTHGTERQKALYLPHMISGAWTGAMNLTEPHSGSDLGTLRTRAEPDGQGGYKLYGQKIFITWGDHDCTDNIVHLVLARLPDAPEGSKGISLFLAPKRLVSDDGVLGAPNDLRPGGIEHKLGIHASPTGVMLFDGAQAELVGQPNKGLAHMFTMMNAARLNVGAQGVGIAERAYQQALAYAQERRQGRSAWTHEASAPIFDHPDVRRTLVGMKAKIEAARAICLLTAINADLSRHAADPAERAAAALREEVLTPIAKAWSTDIGVEVASQGVQIHGGMGFIEETGAAQHYRDARIAPIYEGANGIQAIDLAGRKLAMQDGAGIKALVQDMRATADTLLSNDNPYATGVGQRLDFALDALEGATAWMSEHHGTPAALAGATAYLKLAGEVIGGWLLAKGALSAMAREDQACEDQDWAKGRLALASCYADTVLAQAPGQVAGVTAGADALEAVTAAVLGA